MREADIYRAALENGAQTLKPSWYLRKWQNYKKNFAKMPGGKTTAGVLRRRSQTFKLCWSK